MNKDTLVSTLVSVLLVLGIIYIIPWSNINWGGISVRPDETVTVSGYAQSDNKNELATFTAGVGATNTDKQAAVNEVNTKMDAIVATVKELGVAEDDIKTQSMSIYQYDQFTPNMAGQWRADNTIEIKLRDITKAADLASRLTSSGATNVWGPNYSLDNTNDAQKELLADAIEDAREKADIIAKASGKTLGKVLSVQEGGSMGGYPIPYMDRAMGGGGGEAAMNPGTSMVNQSVTVTFELK